VAPHHTLRELSSETALTRDMLDAGKMDDAVRRAEQAMERLAEMLRDTAPNT